MTLTVERLVAMKPELKVPRAKLKGTTLLNIDYSRGYRKLLVRNQTARTNYTSLSRVVITLTKMTLCDAWKPQNSKMIPKIYLHEWTARF